MTPTKDTPKCPNCGDGTIPSGDTWKMTPKAEQYYKDHPEEKPIVNFSGCPVCGSNKTYETRAIHCNHCAVTTERVAAKKSGGKPPTKLNKMNEHLNLFETVNEANNPACFLGAVSNRVIFSSYVNEKVAWLAYGDFIRFALSNTNGDVRFGYYVDGEPFCSGSFGELRYSGFLKHGC